MLDTEYYNERLSAIRAIAQLDSDIAELNCALDLFDSCAISLLAQEYERTGSLSAAQEALGDYVERGSFSLAKGIANVYNWISNAGTWTLKLVRNMTKFAVTGFKGTVAGALKKVDTIGDDRIKQMQNRRFAKGVSVDTCVRLLDITKEHSFVPDFKLPSGKIAQAKQVFLAAFNAKMKDDAKVNNNFIMANPPPMIKLGTLANAGCDSAKKLSGAGKCLLSCEGILKKRLEEVSKESSEVKAVVGKIQHKQYKDKLVQGIGSISVLRTAYKAAILANDLKYLAKVEDAYVSMVFSMFKKSDKYVGKDKEE